MDSQNLPAKTHAASLTFAQRHPILKQAWDDAVQLSWQQMGVPMLGVVASLSVTLIREYSADHLHGWPDAETFIYSLVLSGLIGVALYALIAIIRAPFIVVGRQQRQLLDVNNRLSEVESRPAASSTPLLSAGSGVALDSAEPNIVMRLDGEILSAWGVQDIIYEGEYSTSYKVIVIRCKNERECSPSRKVGGVGNVSAEISFTGYGDKYFHIPGDLGAWLREHGEQVNFPVGVTHRLVVAKLEDERLSAVQRRSNQNKTTPWSGELDDTSNYFRVKVALYADSQRKPLTHADYILERDGRILGGAESPSGPQLTPTVTWRRLQVVSFQNRLLRFWLDNEGVPSEHVQAKYETCESEAAKFIEQHYGEAEKKLFLTKREEEEFSTSLRLRWEPLTFRERLDAQTKQLERLKETSGIR